MPISRFVRGEPPQIHRRSTRNVVRAATLVGAAVCSAVAVGSASAQREPLSVGGGENQLLGAPVRQLAPPKNVALPTVSGNASAGSALTASAGEWRSKEAVTIGYGWQRCNGSGACTNVAGANSASYIVVASDAGFTFRVVVTASNSGGSTAATSQQTPAVTAPAVPPPAVLWTGDMETGDLNQWSTGGAGGMYNSGIASATASQQYAHSGRYSLRAEISTPSSPTSAVRAFRHEESRRTREAYYSAWFYFPVQFRLTGDPNTGQYWNIFQFKSRNADVTRNDPIWKINLEQHGDTIVPHIVWPNNPLDGPHEGERGYRDYSPLVPMAIPAGRWVHFQAFLRQSKDFDGKIVFWQDGVKIFEATNIRTSYDNPNYNSWNANNEWSVNNYSDGVSPNPAVIYIDDAKVSASYVT